MSAAPIVELSRDLLLGLFVLRGWTEETVAALSEGDPLPAPDFEVALPRTHWRTDLFRQSIKASGLLQPEPAHLESEIDYLRSVIDRLLVQWQDEIALSVAESVRSEEAR